MSDVSIAKGKWEGEDLVSKTVREVIKCEGTDHVGFLG